MCTCCHGYVLQSDTHESSTRLMQGIGNAKESLRKLNLHEINARLVSTDIKYMLHID
jgi:hypothetical protein